MGLTGAGGALVAIPLFMQFLGMSLKEASVYSLLAVVIASFSNFWTQRKFTEFKTGVLIVIFSVMGSFISAPLKKSIPDLLIVILLLVISLYATYTMWFQKKLISNNQSSSKTSFVITFVVGTTLGFLTTLTGLGGGVLMMPVLMNVYSLDQSRAVATSLLAVAISSLSSLIIQSMGGFHLQLDQNILYLTFGIIVSAFLLKWGVKRLPLEKMNFIRKIVFTGVVVLSILKMFNA